MVAVLVCQRVWCHHHELQWVTVGWEFERILIVLLVLLFSLTTPFPDLRSAGINKPIGTAQRINEWLSPSPEIDKLAAACDVVSTHAGYIIPVVVVVMITANQADHYQAW